MYQFSVFIVSLPTISYCLSQYADVDVRDFAVRCLEMLSDSNLSLYLLQLVQV